MERRTSDTAHRQVREMLPWLVNETLHGRDRDRVLRHLRECGACRRERDFLQRLQKEIAGNRESLPNYRFSYQKLMPRIEVAEKNRQSIHESADITAPLKAGSRIRGWLSSAGAAATLVFGVFFVGSLQSPQSPVDEIESRDFLGLTMPVEDADGVRHRLALTFEAGAGPETVRAALIEARASLVGEPDDKGTYIVDLRMPTHSTEAEFIDSVLQIDGIVNAAFLEEN